MEDAIDKCPEAFQISIIAKDFLRSEVAGTDSLGILNMVHRKI